jgi:hypothetical protein
MLLGGDSGWIPQGGSELYRLWPLRVGNSHEFVVQGSTADGSPASWYETYTVAGRETVRTLAGTFDAYVITWEEHGRLGNDFHSTARFWFAPEAGYFVKYEGPRQGAKDESWEATRIERLSPADNLAARDKVPAAPKQRRR